MDACQLDISIQNSLDQVMAAAQNHPNWPADMLLVTGDLSDAEDASDFSTCYRRLAEQWQHLDVNKVCVIPGNHDHSPSFYNVLNQTSRVMAPFAPNETDSWQIIFLDSVRPGHPNGYVNESALIELNQQLAQRRAANTLVAIHHPLLNLAGECEDEQMVTNAATVIDVLARYANITVVAGHAHRAYDSMLRGVRFLGTPATCPTQYQSVGGRYQIAPKQRPGYRWLTLEANGSILTTVHTI